MKAITKLPSKGLLKRDNFYSKDRRVTFEPNLVWMNAALTNDLETILGFIKVILNYFRAQFIKRLRCLLVL
jgi:hypothetical protein